VKMGDVLDRFYILHSPAKGSTEKNPRYAIDDSDIPASEVLSYYVIEKWEFDRRQNRMRARIEAICPVLHRAGDFGAEAVKYPMFWVKYSDLRPYLITQQIFTDDDNNLASSTYDDYFQLGLYEGEIYKTRNLRNKSLMQLYPDPDELTHARDSIQNSLDNYEKKLWVPSLEELAARREAAAKAEAEKNGEGSEVAAADTDKAVNSRATRSSRGSKKLSTKSKPAKVKKPKATKSSPSSTATRSVRNRRR
ncbi:MAG: gliding motility protein GldN, partial [Duncaniella sp.]|nr:gliding motility protein GldN [Duncaniella sp.]